MSLIKSISGIRGTIGGEKDKNLTPLDIVKFTTAYSIFVKEKYGAKTIIVGRDARPSGNMVQNIVSSTLNAMGLNVVDIGFATTPTVEIAVVEEKADGGIIITASHNPVEWNALKLLDNKGEFLSAKDGEKILEIAQKEEFIYSKINEIGQIKNIENYEDRHIAKILELPLVDKNLIKTANFKVAIDCVNSVGSFAIPKLLQELGVDFIEKIYCENNGLFPHNPEPLPQNLLELCKIVKDKNCDVGFALDPDVDRLAIISENGEMFGEEYTLVAVADYILQNKKGATVSNLSSTRALRDLTEEKYKQNYYYSAVGEVNVVAKMKETKAVIGGEGNGGVIYPELHYGRDALVGIALFLTFLAKEKLKVSGIKAKYSNYFIAKNKVELGKNTNLKDIFARIKAKYSNDYEVIDIDGVKINFDQTKSWVHLRASNTEPIIRIYAESTSENEANELAKKFIDILKSI